MERMAFIGALLFSTFLRNIDARRVGAHAAS
jgi:hypothetical protein